MWGPQQAERGVDSPRQSVERPLLSQALGRLGDVTMQGHGRDTHGPPRPLHPHLQLRHVDDAPSQVCFCC